MVPLYINNSLVVKIIKNLESYARTSRPGKHTWASTPRRRPRRIRPGPRRRRTPTNIPNPDPAPRHRLPEHTHQRVDGEVHARGAARGLVRRRRDGRAQRRDAEIRRLREQVEDVVVRDVAGGRHGAAVGGEGGRVRDQWRCGVGGGGGGGERGLQPVQSRCSVVVDAPRQVTPRLAEAEGSVSGGVCADAVVMRAAVAAARMEKCMVWRSERVGWTVYKEGAIAVGGILVLGPAVGLYMSPRAPIEFQSAVLNQPVIGRHLGICTTAMRIDGVGVDGSWNNATVQYKPDLGQRGIWISASVESRSEVTAPCISCGRSTKPRKRLPAYLSQVRYTDLREMASSGFVLMLRRLGVDCGLHTGRRSPRLEVGYGAWMHPWHQQGYSILIRPVQWPSLSSHTQAAPSYLSLHLNHSPFALLALTISFSMGA
ncbi:hypothetical protein M8818_001893 [Zalaria obscura]|uniref:Uncharacterized protein n=1 Tax=Zalaria obscura TaxID=2024903 RepID=A0ACC3SIT2_9PEZI